MTKIEEYKEHIFKGLLKHASLSNKPIFGHFDHYFTLGVHTNKNTGGAMSVMTFKEVVAHLQKSGRTISLLMGNGFSMAYDKEIFSYNALYDFLSSQNDPLLTKLFGAIKTKNFELIMQQLDTTLDILEAFSADADLRNNISQASHSLKSNLLSSINELHPEHVFKVAEEKSAACAEFLNFFLSSGGEIFTTNYDLLLYWVLMRQNVPRAIDGFGRELENPVEVSSGEQEDWSELRWGPNASEQSIHYLHGALHIFDTGTDIVKEEYNSQGFLLENVQARLNDGDYPIFVTAGNGSEKLEHIRHNSYLSHCYDRLCEIDGSLISFGFNFGQYDEHIIDAINKAAKFRSKTPPKLWSIYVGTYSQSDVDHIKSIEHKFHTKVRLFDAKTANVWGENA